RQRKRGLSSPAAGARETDLEANFRAGEAALAQRSALYIRGGRQSKDSKSFQAVPWLARGTFLRNPARWTGIRRRDSSGPAHHDFRSGGIPVGTARVRR